MNKQEIVDRMNEIALVIFDYTNNGATNEDLESLPEVVELDEEYLTLREKLDELEVEEVLFN